MARGASSRGAWAVDAAIVILAKLAASAVVLATAFRALSDDDYSRVVIAERFAQAPAWDPSGTSWLPLPFWVNGGVMMVFGRSIEVARALAIVLATLSALLVMVAARWLGASRAGALLGALLSCALPYAARLGVATVPDGAVAALILLGSASLGSGAVRERAFGALALGAAAASRYEAWPVLAVFSAVTAWDAIGARSGRLAAVAIAPMGVALAWTLHGLVTHGDAFFFVGRVTAYKNALGVPVLPLWQRLVAYPLGLIRFEPELSVLFAVSCWVTWRARQKEALTSYRRLGIALTALLAFLIVGEMRGGAPTHHAERTLLSAWLAGCVFAGDSLSRGALAWVASQRSRKGPLAGVAGLFAALLAVTLLVRPAISRIEPAASREHEVDIGSAARRLLAPTDTLLVDTPDYGFYAVIAAFGRPENARPIDDHNPRHPRVPDPFQSPEDLGRKLADWLVTPRDHIAAITEFGQVRAQNPRFVLLRLRP